MRRAARYSFNVTLMILTFLGILILVEAISYRHRFKFDLTKNKLFTLSPQTVKVLKSLKDEVEAIAFFREEERGRNYLKSLFELYSYHSPKFKYRFVDPDRKPAIARKYGIKEYGTVLLLSGNNKEILYKWDEEKITNGIIKVTRKEKKRVYFLTGHGENDINDISEKGFSKVRDALENEGYEVKEILLVREKGIPKDASVLIINGPKKDLLKEEIEKIREYIDKGGKTLFLVDPGSYPNIEGLLKDYGIILGKDIIVDKMSQLLGADFRTPVISKYNETHPITKDFNIICFFPLCRSVSLKAETREGIKSEILARTGEGSWAETDLRLLDKGKAVFEKGKDKKGPVGVMAISDIEIKKSKKKGRVVVFGDSDFISNTYLDLSGNRDLFLNALSYLAEEENLISIRPKKSEDIPLSLTSRQGNTLFLITVIIIPASVVILGVAVFIRRRYIG